MAEGVVECVDLTGPTARPLLRGFWAVVGDFEGRVRAWRLAHVERSRPPHRAERGTRRDSATSHGGRHGDGPWHTVREASTLWRGPDPGAWRSSLTADEYRAAVGHLRDRIRDGEVYQVNLCRVLSATLPPPGGDDPDAPALAAVLAAGNPAPYAGGVHVPGGGSVPQVWVVSASPELFLGVRDGVVTSAPIKGTARTASGLSGKDRAENIMITDMVRNDLQRVCVPGTVEVSALLSTESHPGLVHLVSTVRGRLADSAPVDWPALFAATYPPASVSGAPKHAALTLIADLETVPRGPYCGAVGWIDADAGRAELAVGIRTFWWTATDGGRLHFGTGAGITWGSDPEAEWAETELKAHRLLALASGGA
jgi:para-aminobenzoate synthetase component I